MRIGLDFDNTIVSYDALFHKVAREYGDVPEDTLANKNAVRDYLRREGREDRWTELQGYVYGARMQEATGYPGALEVIETLRDSGHELFIISHKTKHPYRGPQYDLHTAAREWIAAHLLDRNGKALIAASCISFYEHKEEKIAAIVMQQCEVFLDDLPEILLHEAFPPGVEKFLFAPQQATALPDGAVRVVTRWEAFRDALA